MAKQFFEECTEHSRVKREIVTKYFAAWSNVIKYRSRENRIGYFDLFAGPGRYDDGTKSTPLLILEQAIQDDKLSQMLVSMFNDNDPNHTQSLSKAIRELEPLRKLSRHPCQRSMRASFYPIRILMWTQTSSFNAPTGPQRPFLGLFRHSPDGCPRPFAPHAWALSAVYAAARCCLSR